MTNNRIARAAAGAILVMAAGLAIAADHSNVPVDPKNPVPAPIPESSPPPPPPAPGARPFEAPLPSLPEPVAGPPPGYVPAPAPAAPAEPVKAPEFVPPPEPIHASPTEKPTPDEKARWCAAAAKIGVESESCTEKKK